MSEWRDEVDALFNSGVGPFKSASAVVESGAIAGDLIEFRRTGYRHWGVYVGNQEVVHVHIGDEGEKKNGLIMKQRIGEVCSDGGCRVNNLEAMARTKNLEKNSPALTAQNALDRVGTYIDYNLFTNNCEFFATDCKYSNSFSRQVETPRRATNFWTQVLGGRSGMEMIADRGRGNGWTEEQITDFMLSRDDEPPCAIS